MNIKKLMKTLAKHPVIPLMGSNHGIGKSFLTSEDEGYKPSPFKPSKKARREFEQSLKGMPVVGAL